MRAWVRSNLSSILLVTVCLLVAGEAVAFVIVIPLANRVSSQAQAGKQAKLTQCDREPVFSKTVAAAYAVRHALPPETRITRHQLDVFLAQAPQHCPKP